jgi:O-acetyl-ADP-ribose deacetylase (regulator of RNase III)
MSDEGHTGRLSDLDTDRVELIRGDITEMRVDAVVNAANSSLLGGGGVDGAIHRAAGPELLAACRALGGCPTGEAKLTKGYNLPARFVIHTVGPVWRGGGHGEEELLARCYRSCFALARAQGLRSLAFPSISTGAYGFPIERAARIALREIGAAMRTEDVDRVLVVLFSQRDLEVYLEAAGRGC